MPATNEISGPVTTTVVLDNVSYAYNLTIDSDGSVIVASGDGVDTSSDSTDADVPSVFLDNLGTITAGNGGVGLNWLRGNQVTNQGTINGGSSTSGSGGAAVEITGTTVSGSSNHYGYVQSSGTLMGGDGLTRGGDGVIVNANGSFSNNITGTVQGGSGDSGGVGVLVNGGGASNSNTIKGGSGTTGGDGAIVNGGSLTNTGTITGGGGTSVNGVGVLVENGGTFYDFGTVVGGTVTVPRPALVRAAFTTDSTPSSQGDAIDFGSGSNTLAISAGTEVNGTIGGFAAGDMVTVYGASAITINSPTATSISITYTYDSGADTGTLTFAGDYQGDSLTIVNQGGALTFEFTAACYVRGTRIRTPDGDRAIESLSAGSEVITLAGETRRVRWVGHRAIDCSTHPSPAEVWPILIAANAFAEEVPCRDLWVSPGHSIYREGTLIQALNLVNGVTVQQIPQQRVEYWHVELDSHDVIFADGLAAETYLDTGNRTAFVDGGAYLELHPTFKPHHWRDTCYPLECEGPTVQRAHRHLLERIEILGRARAADADPHLIVDGARVEPTRLTDRRLAFLIPVMSSRIELRSRTFVPAHRDASSPDRRSLGLCVGRLQLDGVEVALDGNSRFGWHELETDVDGRQWRWTHESVEIPAGTRLLVVDQAWLGQYWAHTTTRSPVDAAVSC